MELATAQLVKITSAEQCRALPSAAGLPVFDPQLLQAHRPDAHWAVMDGEVVTARCSLWWRSRPAYRSHQVGLIGHYAAKTDEAAEALLQCAVDELTENGCTLAVGPLDGNTWRDYRFVTEEGDAPPFFLEPANPPQWPVQFSKTGFHEFARYFSAVAENLAQTSGRIERVRNWMESRGVHIRCLAEDRFDVDLRQIHTVVTSAFHDHLLFSPVGESEFLEQFAPLRRLARPELVLIAEQSERIVGFCFGIPDLLQAERGKAIDTAILKTLGVIPGREFAGLGQLLMERFHQQAGSLGFRRVIHALVRETGHLQRISRRYAVPVRRYALFARELVR